MEPEVQAEEVKQEEAPSEVRPAVYQPAYDARKEEVLDPVDAPKPGHPAHIDLNASK